MTSIATRTRTDYTIVDASRTKKLESASEYARDTRYAIDILSEQV